MKDMYFFEYVPENTLLGKTPAVIKLLFLIGLCIFAAAAPVHMLPYTAVFMIPVFFIAGTGPARQLRGMWPVHIFIIFSGIIKAVGSEAAVEGAALSGRMFIMLCGSVLFYAGTSTSELRSALGKLLAPLPRSTGKRIADLAAMTMAFLPLIFKTVSELKTAAEARGFRNSLNFPKTIRMLSIPLIIDMLIKSDELTDACYSRCFGLDQKPAVQTISRSN